MHSLLATARRISKLVPFLLLSAACSTPVAGWRDTQASRVEALAVLQTLNADVLASSSATSTLERWCSDHRLAEEPKIVAMRDASVQKKPTDEQLQRLGVSSPEDVRYRRVELRCGTRTLSEADNWYVPARLTPEMNVLLDTTDTPFGRVVRPLQPYRRTISARVLWLPLEPGWELRSLPPCRVGCNRPLAIPHDLLEHRALLYTADHRPFAEVVETYRNELLSFR